MATGNATTRTEHDSFGDIEVAADRLWGAQTQRSLQHFAISTERMPDEIILALATVKSACARVNGELGLLRDDKAAAIIAAAEEVRAFGAIGFLPKDSDLGEIERAIARALGGQPVRAVPAGQTPLDSIRREVAELTPMQFKVLLAVLDGQLNKQIAHALGISEATVKAHMTAIMRKLDVSNRTQAALVARSLGLDLRH